MEEPQVTPTIDVPRADAWLAAGLTALAMGVWLLKRDDPFLLALWGVGFLIVGTVSSVVSLGMFLRIWR